MDTTFPHTTFLRVFYGLLCLSIPVLAGPSNRVTISNSTGSVQSNRPFTISRVFAKGEIPQCAQAKVNGSLVSTQCDAKTRWPDRSLKHALVSFVATVPASGSLPVEFVNQSNGNNAGEMDKAAMLAANWGAQIQVTNGTTLTADARKILSDWSGATSDTRVTYWLKGPICTQVILEDRTPTLAYDMGFGTSKPLHPIFVVTFYPGASSGVKVEMILENMWSTKLQDQTYSLVLKTGNPLSVTPVYTKSSFAHYAKTRWRKTFWSGPAPGAIKTDYNLAYLAHSGAVPNFDLSKVVPANAISGDVSAFNASDKGDINGSAMWLKYMPQTGGRDDLGLFPAWYVRYLYTFDPQLHTVMEGLAAVSGYAPVHMRESDASLKFDEARTVDAFGRPASVDARPTMWGLNPGATLNSSHGWAIDQAHQASFAYIPYLITGDWYYLEELYYWSSFNLFAIDPANVSWGRNGAWGIISWSAQTRGIAWALRTLAHAAWMAPDGTPEKDYFTQKLNNNIAVREGDLNITNGAFYDSSTGSKWHWGRNTYSNNLGPNPLHFPNAPDVYASKDGMQTSGANQVQHVDSNVMYGYLGIVYGHINELGFPIAKVQESFAKHLMNQLANPSYNPYLSGAYRVPVTKSSTGKYYQTWADVKQAYISSYQTTTTWPSADEGNINHGYPHIIKAAASFGVGISDGAVTGQAAWNWVSSHVGYQNLVGINPQWAILPRSLVSNTVVSSCDINSDGAVNSADVQLTVNQVLGQAPCTADLDANGSCNVVDLQRIINSAQGDACRLGL